MKKQFVLIYSGDIGPHRSVDMAIRGMKYLENNPKIQLAIVGYGSQSVMNSLHQLVDELQLEDVHFLGYQPVSKFYSYMHMASVNVIPHQSNGHTDNTLPHKLFQSMMAGKPLLVSFSAPLKRLIELYEAGLVFETGQAEDFAEKVKTFPCDRELCSKLG